MMYHSDSLRHTEHCPWPSHTGANEAAAKAAIKEAALESQLSEAAAALSAAEARIEGFAAAAAAAEGAERRAAELTEAHSLALRCVCFYRWRDNLTQQFRLVTANRTSTHNLWSIYLWRFDRCR